MSEVSVTNYPDIHGSHVKLFQPAHESDSRPLALFNGIGAGNEQWGKFPEELDRPIVAIDVSKSVTKLLPTMENYKDAAIDVLDELEIDKFDAMGLSWGALLTEELALDNRARIGRIVLAAGASYIPIMPPTLMSSIILSSPNHSTAYLEKHSKAVFGGDTANNLDLIYKLDVSRSLNDIHYRGQVIAALGSMRNIFRLAFSDIPVLLMASDDDPIVRYENIAFINMITANSTLHKVRKGGHLFPLTCPVETAKTVNNFLDKPL